MTEAFKIVKTCDKNGKEKITGNYIKCPCCNHVNKIDWNYYERGNPQCQPCKKCGKEVYWWLILTEKEVKKSFQLLDEAKFLISTGILGKVTKWFGEAEQ